MKQKQASCIFQTATFQSILMVQKLLCADSIIAHIKKEKKKFACQRGILSAGFYYGLVAFPISEWQLPHAVLLNFVLQM